MPDSHVVVAGASGLIGRALVSSYRNDGIRVVELVRREPRTADEVRWRDGTTDYRPVLDGAAAVFCLNGSSIGQFPWTARRRTMLRQSRVLPRQDLAAALREMTDPPPFIHASAIGYYGNTAGATVSEADPRGAGFLADIVVATEDAANLAADHTRVTHARMGIVMDPDGVLKPMIALALLGLGGKLGTGRQSWPWVSLPDAVAALRFLATSEISGPANITSPTRATANDVGFALARELNKPFLIPAPAWALRTVLGKDAADSMLLSDSVVVPSVLVENGFLFADTNIETTLHHALTPLRFDS